jgi:hypothetical protein
MAQTIYKCERGDCGEERCNRNYCQLLAAAAKDHFERFGTITVLSCPDPRNPAKGQAFHPVPGDSSRGL